MVTKFQNKEIHFTDTGTGETLVLLHGFLESKDIWDEFVPEFSKYGRIITIDLPGHGKSECITEVHTMEIMAQVVYTVLTELKVEKANFIGHSMGGYVILAFLEVHPEMVHEIMLLNSTPEEDTEEKRTNRDRAVEVVRKNKKSYVSMAISNLLPPENEKKFSNKVSELKERAYAFPTKGITAALKGMKIRTNRLGVLKQHSGPKLIVSGAEDTLIDFKKIRKLAKESETNHITLPGGHLSYLECRKEFLKLCISSKK